MQYNSGMAKTERMVTVRTSDKCTFATLVMIAITLDTVKAQLLMRFKWIRDPVVHNVSFLVNDILEDGLKNVSWGLEMRK